MKLDVRAESLIEQLALWLGLAPTPLVETHIAATLARSVVAGVKLGFFECLREGPLTHTDIAARCGVDPAAAKLLLDALVACGYLRLVQGRFALKAKSRNWLLRDSAQSIRDKILLQAIEWGWLAQLDDFVRTGRPIDFHTEMSAEERDLYHRSMRALAGIAGREVAWRTPVPRNARLMLDLGGSHGHYAAEICRRHPGLSGQVLDLPNAIDMAAPLLAAEAMGDRVVHVSGDVLQADLGVERYDLIFMSNLAHHLDREENQALAIRAQRALRPDGFFVIQEPVRVDRPERGGQTAALLGLYFALQSRPDVNTWSIDEIADWQTKAGLRVRRPIRLRTAPGWFLQAAQL
ncbi:MAG TPA: methyltransferase [Caulobacteraceae bacterium]